MTLPTLDGRRTAFHGFIRDLIKSGKIDGSRWSMSYRKIKNLAHTEQATNLCRLQKVEQTCGTPPKTRTELVISKKSMFDIDYEPYDVIYFDPPYADTKGYDKAKFDFDRFHSLIDGLVDSGKQVYV